jgi:glutamate N-acetyltransferase/amino-acid N-acetyltransferase
VLWSKQVKQNENIVHGFKASGVQAGLKKVKALDLALIFSERESVAAGVFTTNRVVAAPVVLTQEHVRNGKARAIIANAGNANACTGKAGLDNARLTAELLAGRLGLRSDEVLVASTGSQWLCHPWWNVFRQKVYPRRPRQL